MTEPTPVPHHLRHDPALDADDLATAALLSRGMQTVTMGRPVPRAAAATARADAPRASRVRVRRWAPAVLSAAAVALVLVVTTRAPGVAWSATPAAASATDEAEVTARCAEGLRPEVGVDRPVPPPDAGPTALPPLGVLDVRGTGAVAVFADGSWTVECVLTRTGGGWERLVTVASPTEPLGEVAAVAPQWHGSTTLPDGSVVSYLGGVAAPGTASVRLELPGREPVLASLADGRFALWWPGDLPVADGRLVALDGGEKGEIGSIDLDFLAEPDDGGAGPARPGAEEAERERPEPGSGAGGPAEPGPKDLPPGPDAPEKPAPGDLGPEEPAPADAGPGKPGVEPPAPDGPEPGAPDREVPGRR